MAEKVREIQMDKLVGFHNHPFQVKDDETLNALCESIRDYGVLSPLLARPTVDGNYEIQQACPSEYPSLSQPLFRTSISKGTIVWHCHTDIDLPSWLVRLSINCLPPFGRITIHNRFHFDRIEVSRNRHIRIFT